MKKKTVSIVSLLSSPMLLSGVAFAENGISIQKGAITLSYCDAYNPGALFIVTKEGISIARGKSNEVGCLRETLSGLKSCDEVALVFKNDRIVYQVPGQYCSNPQPPPKPAPQDLADIEKVKKTADNKARQFANKVASEFEYGKSNYIYNFIVGYERGIDVNENQALYKIAYTQAQLKGIQAGNSAGYLAGSNAATIAAQDKAKKDVYAQINQGLDSNKDIVPVLDKNIPAYSGLSNSIGSLTLGEVLKSDDARNLIIRKFHGAGYALSESQVKAVMNRAMNLRDILFDLDSDWAFHAHLKDQEVKDYVESLKSKDNATAAVAAYESQFKDVYWSVIDDKVAKKIVQPQIQAQQSGVDAGQSLIVLVAKSQGEDAGYTSAYKPASVKGFTVTYPSVYGNSFASHVNRLNSSMEICDVKASITDAQGGQQFVIGQPVKLTVAHAVNLGKLSGPVDVSISGAIEAKANLDLKGQSRNQGLVIENIGHISPLASLGTQKVEITIGGITISQNIEITWANQLKALTTVQDPDALAHLSSFIVGTLLQEWKTVLNNKTVVQEKALYRDAKAYPKSLMGQFESLAASLKAKNPDMVNSIGGQLLTVFYSMFSPASVEDYAKTWLSKKADPEAFKKAYADARTQVTNNPLLSQFANGCVVGPNGAPGSCVGAIEMKSTDDYNKWTTGKMKVEAILKK